MKISSDEFNFHGGVYLITVFNGRTAGNIELAYKSKIDDGLLDVILFKSRPKGGLLPMFIDVGKKEHLDTDHDGIYHFKTKELKIECTEGLSTDIDGEEGPSYPVKIKVLASGIRVLGVVKKDVLI